jgi:hypothetical protein
MEENTSEAEPNPPASETPVVAPETPGQETPTPETPAQMTPEDKEVRQQVIILSIIGVVVVLAIIGAAIFLMNQPVMVTAQIRDVFIIFMALESLVIGVALVVLIIQISILTNLLQNEIKPILTSTNETVSTLRGTVIFLSDNLVEPVMKMNEYLAGIKRLGDIFFPRRK